MTVTDFRRKPALARALAHAGNNATTPTDVLCDVANAPSGRQPTALAAALTHEAELGLRKAKQVIVVVGRDDTRR